MAIPPDIRIRLEQLRGEMAAKAEAQRRQQQAQANAEKMSKQFVPGKAEGGLVWNSPDWKPHPENDLLQPIGASRMVGDEKLLSQDDTFSHGVSEFPSSKKSYRYLYHGEDNKPIGAMQIQTAGPRSKKAVIQNLYVAEANRREGIASKLLQRARQDFDVKHSTDLTSAGRAFAEAVKAKGGEVKAPSLDTMRLALNKQGMYSPLEKAAMSIPRTKGTPAEFMAEISKQPGFRKDEVEDRKISLPEQKMTKNEFLGHLKNHPAPLLNEQVYHSEDEEEGDQTQYGDYQLPGGQNYREVLLKTPTFSPAKDRQIMELESNIRRMNPDDYPPGYVQNMIDGVSKLKAEKAAMGNPYQSSHWMDDPNVLAHMRLSDRYVGDTGKFAVMGTKNGKTRFLFQTGINGTPEQAQEAAKRWQDQGYETSINQVGGGKKLLHIEEIQSDWHQQGRKQGYRSGEAIDRFAAQRMKDEIFGRFDAGEIDREQRNALLDELSAKIDEGNKVPDAPFKKNWHELALKHAIGIAAREGYDGIVITPGQQQADRYDLSKHIDELHYNPDLGTLVGNKDRQGKLYERGVTPDKLESYVGKEVAAKIMAQEPNEGGMRSLVGQQLTVGGEGMKGFYDKIVPTFLNKFGKPHGAQVQMNAVPLTGTINIDDYVHPSETEDVARIKSQSMHYFPITDSMRQQVKTEGLPQYVRGGKVQPLLPDFED